MTFDHPTAAAITALLLTMRGGSSRVALAADVSVDGSSIASWDSGGSYPGSEWLGQQPVAIAAIAAATPVAPACGDAPQAVPVERWDADQYVSAANKDAAKLETRFGAFVAGAELFDAAAFNVSRCGRDPGLHCISQSGLSLRALISSPAPKCDLKTEGPPLSWKDSLAVVLIMLLTAKKDPVKSRIDAVQPIIFVCRLHVSAPVACACDTRQRKAVTRHLFVCNATPRAASPPVHVRRPEAVYMDAQQRLLLMHAAEALSALPHAESAAAATSVMVGIGTVDYTAMVAHLGNSLYAASGAASKQHAGRTTIGLYSWRSN